MRLLNVSLLLLSLGFGMAPRAQAQSSLSHSKVVIDDVELRGAAHLPETVKERLVDSLKRTEYAEGSEWTVQVADMVSSAVADGWPNRENEGYVGFSASVQWKPTRREPGVLHVSVSIQVDEGKQKRVATIDFRYVDAQSAPPVFAKAELRKLISLKDGEVYERDKYYAGLSAISRAYSEKGFIDCTVTNNMQLDQDNQTISILVDINEDRQYRWGKIDVHGLDPKMETLLRAQLQPGSPANPKPIEDFYRDNQSLLPVGASPKDVKWQRDVERAAVDLTFDFGPHISP